MDEELAKNLLAIWQSELTAMAADRELHESWAAMVQLWAQATSCALTAVVHEPSSRSTVPAQPSRPAPPHAAPEPCLDEVNALSKRVFELEQQLAELLARRDNPRPSSNTPDL